MEKVKYKCKGCGWTKELSATWGSDKPRFCVTPTCEMSLKKSKGRKSFRTHPDMLEVTLVKPGTKEKKDNIKQEVASVKEKRSRRSHVSSGEGGTLPAEAPSAPESEATI